MHKNYCVVSGVLFTLVAIAHAYRLVAGIEVSIAGTIVPMWPSWFGAAVPALLAIWAFRLAAR